MYAKYQSEKVVEINNLAPGIQDSNDNTSKYISALYSSHKSVHIQIFALISRLAVIGSEYT